MVLWKKLWTDIGACTQHACSRRYTTTEFSAAKIDAFCVSADNLLFCDSRLYLPNSFRLRISQGYLARLSRKVISQSFGRRAPPATSNPVEDHLVLVLNLSFIHQFPKFLSISFVRQIRLPRQAGEANLPDKT
ncbi:MAG: hypothetical protein NTZ50_07895, partial [Chloroflexi bacterium]|nr:hypothetical protein [Chloroflexota bacterium]